MLGKLRFRGKEHFHVVSMYLLLVTQKFPWDLLQPLRKEKCWAKIFIYTPDTHKLQCPGTQGLHRGGKGLGQGNGVSGWLRGCSPRWSVHAHLKITPFMILKNSVLSKKSICRVDMAKDPQFATLYLHYQTFFSVHYKKQSFKLPFSLVCWK